MNIFSKSYEVIKQIFILNGFYFKFIDKVKYNVLSKISNSFRSQDNTINTIYWKLSFLKCMENSNLKVIKRINTLIGPNSKASIAYQTRKTASFFKNKDKIPMAAQSNLMYQILCYHCPGHCYVGETERHFATRADEHIRGKPEPSEVALHQHVSKMDNFLIILKTKYTKIAEALIFSTVPPQFRLNNYRPPFQLRLFTAEASNPHNSL